MAKTKDTVKEVKPKEPKEPKELKEEKKVTIKKEKEADIKVKEEKKEKPAPKKEKAPKKPAPPSEDKETTEEKEVTEEKTRKPRRVVTRDIVNENLDKIIENISALEGKAEKSILRELKVLKNDLKKVMKKKGSEKKRGVANSGFFKEVPITDDLASFMDAKKDELKSRVDVTRFICKYVKDKNLQDQENKKIIVPDEPLRKLLKHDIKVDGALTFPSVQKLIQKHFVKA
jgi:chromatin remodeling complex protein RSC6